MSSDSTYLWLLSQVTTVKQWLPPSLKMAFKKERKEEKKQGCAKSFVLYCYSRPRPSPLKSVNHTQDRSSFLGKLSLEMHSWTHLERCFTSLRGTSWPSDVTIKINHYTSLHKSLRVGAFQILRDCSPVLLCSLLWLTTDLFEYLPFWVIHQWR